MWSAVSTCIVVTMKINDSFNITSHSMFLLIIYWQSNYFDRTLCVFTTEQTFLRLGIKLQRLYTYISGKYCL